MTISKTQYETITKVVDLSNRLEDGETLVQSGTLVIEHDVENAGTTGITATATVSGTNLTVVFGDGGRKGHASLVDVYIPTSLSNNICMTFELTVL